MTTGLVQVHRIIKDYVDNKREYDERRDYLDETMWLTKYDCNIKYNNIQQIILNYKIYVE